MIIIRYLISLLIFLQIGLTFYQDYSSTFIADSLLKSIQGNSLFANNFSSEEIYYPGLWADESRSGFLFDKGFSKNINGKYIGVFPILFSFYAGVILKLGLVFIPIIAIVLLLIAFNELRKINKAPLIFCFLYYFSSIINNSFFELNESSLFFTISAIGFSQILLYLRKNENLKLFIGFFVLSFAVWFRLEAILFIISIILSLTYLHLKNKKNNLVNKILIVSIGIIPIYLFILWNYLSYGHILGPRYLFNFENSTLWIDRIIRIISMSFFYKDYTGIKMGIFFCSPFLLLALFHFLNNREKNNNLLQFSFYVFLFQFVFVSFTAPNDGITLTSRYHLLLVIPGFYLTYDYYLSIKSVLNSRLEKLAFAIALCIGIFTSFGWILFSKEISKFNVFASEGNPDLYIVKNDQICGSMGMMHIEKSVFCIRKIIQEKSILKKIQENRNIHKLTYIIYADLNDNSKIDSIKKALYETNFTLQKINSYKKSRGLIFIRNN